MRNLILTAAVILASAFSAEAAEVCNALDGASRVLQSTNPNDISPDWRSESYIGTDWYFVPAKSLSQDGLEYMRGDLYSPRGSLQGEVYVLAREWECRE